jgi:Transposase DDE domain
LPSLSLYMSEPEPSSFECARSVETTRRSALADAADYGRCASHSRFFWGFRLHGLFAPDGTPRAFTLASPKRDEREVGLELLERANRVGGATVIGDKGYAGRRFAAAVADLGATIVRPARKNEPGSPIHLAPIRQRVESIFWTCKDISPWSATALALSPTCVFASPSASWRWPPASRSTTISVVRAALWSTTSPEGVESII